MHIRVALLALVVSAAAPAGGRAQTLTTPPTKAAAVVKPPSHLQTVDGPSLDWKGPLGSSIADYLNGTAGANGARDVDVLFDDLVGALTTNAQAIQDQLAKYAENPAPVVALAKNGDPTARDVLLAAYTLDPAGVGVLLNKLRADAKGDPANKDLAGAISTVTRTIEVVQQATGGPPTNQILVALLAQGNVRGAIAGGDSSSSAGSGSIGLSVAYQDWAFTGLITVASTIDTLRSGFGPFVLSPATGRGSLSTFLLDLYTPTLWDVLPFDLRAPAAFPGLHIYFAGANSTWEARIPVGTGGDSTTDDKNAAAIAVGVLANWRLLRGHLQNVPVEVHFETGIGWRTIRGDVFGDTELRRAAFQFAGAGKVPTAWRASESGVQMKIGAVTAAAQYYTSIGGNISGLSHGQLIIGIAVSGEVVSGALSP